ncbi:MAG: hypothetical protein GY940_07155 [bacterium]|nr:hypothetical protein [bacterium]
MAFTINVANNLEVAGRDLMVFHQNGDEPRERKLNFPGNGGPGGGVIEFPFHLGKVPGKNDWLEIGVFDENNDLEGCRIDLSPNLPFLLIPGETGEISAKILIDKYGTVIKIPGGPPTWKLKLLKPHEPVESTLSMSKTSMATSESSKELPDNGHNVTVGDDGPGGNGGNEEKSNPIPWYLKVLRWIKNLFK